MQQIQVNKKLDILKGFNKLFKDLEQTTDKDDLIPQEELKGFMSDCSVVMIVPKKHSFKARLKELYDLNEEKDIPSLDYFPLKNGMEHRSMFSSEYLKLVLELTKHYDKIAIKTSHEYPLWIECDDFILIIAPRVNTNGEEDFK